MASKDFEKLVKQQEAKRNLLTKKVKKEIRDSYIDIWKNANKDISKAKEGSLNINYLKAMQKSLEGQIKALNNDINKRVKSLVEESVDMALNPQLDFFMEINNKYELGLASTFQNMFATIHTEVVAEVLGGKIYKDRQGLSKRIWADTKRFDKDIDKIIGEAIAGKRDAVNVAKDLVKYLNPNQKQSIMAGVRGTPGFNAYRLAHTSIMHSYQQAQKRSCSKNPYITKIQWLASNHANVCEICKDRDGTLYEVKDVPLDTLWDVVLPYLY